ncbi:transcriptional regulator, AraC family [Nitratireductor aquibiodomus]|uniref:Transcriptional regulator, AraC family n=2 Tax=Nitratireductor aquibiodomus TaxID=204799 RepID=A0A1H4J351_9HYPH|nr:transcriptional regulator, AraC family [Nitratireductor aquibiodomus]
MRSRIPNFRLYEEKSDESSDFWLHCETLSARSALHNWQIDVHRHNALFQMFWMTEGGGTLFGDGKTEMPFSAPCAIFIPPGAAHGFRFFRHSEGVVATVLADRLALPGGSDRTLAEFLSHTRIVSVEHPVADKGEDLDRLFQRLLEEHSRHGGVGRDLMLDVHVTEILVRLARAGARSTLQALHKAMTIDSRRVQALETLIAAHFREHRPVGFYAGKIGVSVAQLNRIARQEAGASVSHLLARRLVDAARRDLIFTPTPVQAIAYSLGFQDPAYFNRFFRRQTGTTPGTYRETERRRLAA